MLNIYIHVNYIQNLKVMSNTEFEVAKTWYLKQHTQKKVKTTYKLGTNKFFGRRPGHFPKCALAISISAKCQYL